MDVEKNTPEEKSIYILKGRFKSNSLNFYGLFLIIFNPRGDMEASHVLVSTFSTVYEMEPHFNWEKYEEFIVNSKWKGNYNPNMTASIDDSFKKISSDQNGQKEILYEYIKKYDYDNIDTTLFDVINRIIHDKNLIIETGIQETSENEFRQTKEKSKKNDDKSKTDENKKVSPDEGVTLTIQLILLPVSGKPIYEIKIGDIIMCRILPNTDRANYFIDLLDLRVENMIKPVPGKVIDIKSEGKNDPIEILTEIGPGIYGKCIEGERQVKIRMYDPAVDERVNNKNIRAMKNDGVKESFASINKSSFSLNKILYVAIGILFIIGLLILTFYLFII